MKYGDLEGKVALVTGGSSGIGKATALAYAAQNMKVAIADINTQGAQTVAKQIQEQGGNAIALTANVASSSDVQQMIQQVVDHFGSLDVAFNNAGIELETTPTHQVEEAMFDQLMSVNVKGVWLCMKYEIEHMLKQPSGGAIINTASVGGLIGAPRMPIYGATKHAVVGMTKTAAVEYGKKGIRVNSVCPGIIKTDMAKEAFERDPRRESNATALHPIGRLGEAEEVANSVLFLSSAESSFVLGHQLMVDGGFVAI
ncbi:MAG: SDR family oxidoreductase [Pseudomonadales bacterium]|nr:SDR family oxidoreductase [Pseudomonadales bacterium]